MNTGDGQRGRVLGATWEDPAMRECARAWFESESHEVVPEATHYHADYVRPEWARAQGMVFVARIGRHVFLRELTVA